MAMRLSFPNCQVGQMTVPLRQVSVSFKGVIWELGKCDSLGRKASISKRHLFPSGSQATETMGSQNQNFPQWGKEKAEAQCQPERETVSQEKISYRSDSLSDHLMGAAGAKTPKIPAASDGRGHILTDLLS